MDVEVGKSYHIKNDFFELVQDLNLMTNKENGNYRPHFFFIKDPAHEKIYWAIPQSSRVEKYKELIQRKKQKHGKCNTIIIGKFGGKENAFLIQNMFPVIEKYVAHEHLINDRSILIHKKLSFEISSNALQVLSMKQKGINLIFPNVDKIYQIMIDELNS